MRLIILFEERILLFIYFYIIIIGREALKFMITKYRVINNTSSMIDLIGEFQISEESPQKGQTRLFQQLLLPSFAAPYFVEYLCDNKCIYTITYAGEAIDDAFLYLRIMPSLLSTIIAH